MGLFNKHRAGDDENAAAVKETKREILRILESSIIKAAEETYNLIETKLIEKASKSEFQEENENKTVEETLVTDLTCENLRIEINGRIKIIDAKENAEFLFERKDLFDDFMNRNELLTDSDSVYFRIYKWDLQIKKPFLRFLKTYKVYAKPILTMYGDFYFETIRKMCKKYGITVTPMICGKYDGCAASEYVNINESFLYRKSISRKEAYSCVKEIPDKYHEATSLDEEPLADAPICIKCRAIYE